jgi:5'-nucleotidase
MNILVTNDDGVKAPGLMALAEAMLPFGNVEILAPDHNWSISGHVKTLHRPLSVQSMVLENGMNALATDGAPSDCVALALLGLLKKPVDLVVSGINPSANLGHDVTYSGTVTAAMEAVIWGVRAVSFSLDGPEHMTEGLNYQAASMAAKTVVALLLENELPGNVFLNVNIPNIAQEQIKGYKVTRQGLRIYHDVLIERNDPRQKPYYWIGGDGPSGVIEDGTDIGELSKGYISITPLTLDLTSHKDISEIDQWTWSKKFDFPG